MKKINMIKAAQHVNEASQLTHTRLAEIANQTNMTVDALTESVTQVLATFALSAENGKPFTALTNVDSIAAFLAGVEALAQALPRSQNPDAKQNTIRRLLAINIGPDRKVSPSAAVIAEHGMKYPDLVSKYKQLVIDYGRSLAQRRPEGSGIASAIRALQQQIDQAMRVAQQPARQSLPPSGPSRAGSMPSGGSGV